MITGTINDFEVVCDRESFSLTYDMEEWKTFIDGRIKDIKKYNSSTYTHFDMDLVNRLQPYISGFVVSPVSKIDGYISESNTLKTNNCDEIFEFFSNPNKRFYLYMVNWIMFPPLYMDSATFDPIQKPEFIQNHWQIRYVEIPLKKDLNEE